MTTNTKILLGVGAIALAYYFYTKSKGSGAINQGNVSTPQKPYMPQVNPFSEGGALEPRKINSNLQTTIYNCKDGTKVSRTIDVTKAMLMKFEDPCRNNGGVLDNNPARYSPTRRL
jgi:hypothetical protein